MSKFIQGILKEAFEHVDYKITKTAVGFIIKAFSGHTQIGTINISNHKGNYPDGFIEDFIDEDEYKQILNGNPYFLIENVNVSKYARGEKVGSELVKKAIEEMKKTNIKIVMLDANPTDGGENKAEFLSSLSKLIKWYSELGFIEIAHLGGDCLMIRNI